MSRSPRPFHAVDELLVGGIQHLLPELGLLGLLRLERIEERLVLAGGIDASLDTELLHGADETEAGRRHADGTDQAGLVGVDLVGGAGDVVGAGGTQVADHRIDLDVRVLAAQATNLVIDIARLHRTAARTVDPQDDPLVPSSLNAARRAVTILSALAGSSSAIMPFTSISAVWLRCARPISPGCRTD